MNTHPSTFPLPPSGPAPAPSALDEEIARAEVYGLLAALYQGPPSPQVLEQLRLAVTQAPSPGAFLEASWEAVVAASRAASDQQIDDEYEALFGGVGKPEVYLFSSYYLSGFLNERPLVRLRSDLAALGLEAAQPGGNTEDHIACLSEVMRYLIAADDVAVANLTQQKRFFADHWQPWVDSLCDALVAHPQARFYAALAEFTRAFTQVESQGFDMLT